MHIHCYKYANKPGQEDRGLVEFSTHRERSGQWTEDYHGLLREALAAMVDEDMGRPSSQ